MKSNIVKEVCPCCDKEVDMYIETDEDYEWADGQPLIFRRCSSCENESIDPKRNPSNLELERKEKKRGDRQGKA